MQRTSGLTKAVSWMATISSTVCATRTRPPGRPSIRAWTVRWLRPIAFIFVALSMLAFGSVFRSTSGAEVAQKPVVPPEWLNAVFYGDWHAAYNAPLGGKIAFVRRGAAVLSIDGLGNIIAESQRAEGDISSGFDFNGDGVSDFAITAMEDKGDRCAGKIQYTRRIEVYSGADHSSLTTLGPMLDRCFPNLYPYTSLWTGSLDFGPRPGLLALVPQYHSTGWWVDRTDAMVSPLPFYTPETSAYELYTAARPALHLSADGKKYLASTQPLNGMIIRYQDSDQYVAFSSGRVMRFAHTKVGPAQLLADVTFLARTDLVGRTYGLITHDQRNPNLVHLLSGDSVVSLYQDLCSKTIGSNSWAGLERHVSLYDMSTDRVQQRFLSYVYDNDRGNSYQNRLLFPSSATLPAANGQSHLVFNLLVDGVWSVHVTVPGSTESHSVTNHLVVWDVIPRDADTVDLLASPVDPKQPAISQFQLDGKSVSIPPARYFPSYETVIYRWTRTKPMLSELRRIDGAIPALTMLTSGRATEAASSGHLSPAIRGLDSATRSKPVLVLTDRHGERMEAVIDW